MIDKLPSIQKLMRQLQYVPFLASKNLYRVSSYFLTLDQQRIHQFCKTLQEVHQEIILCSICFFWQQKSAQCVFCFDRSRDRSVICVVESWHELLVLERTQSFKGLYHILGGIISPLEGISAQDLKIDQLVARVDDSIVEIIFSMNQTPEGEATAAFIAKKLQHHALKITCLAKGVPVGSHLEFVDRLTLGKAMIDRKLF